MWETKPVSVSDAHLAAIVVQRDSLFGSSLFGTEAEPFRKPLPRSTPSRQGPGSGLGLRRGVGSGGVVPSVGRTKGLIAKRVTVTLGC